MLTVIWLCLLLCSSSHQKTVGPFQWLVKLNEAEKAFVQQRCNEETPPSQASKRTFMAALFEGNITEEYVYRCGAVFVSQRHLLTTASCFSDSRELHLILAGVCSSGSPCYNYRELELEYDFAIFENAFKSGIK